MTLLRSTAYGCVVLLGTLLWSREATAFCREVTASPPLDYDPVTQGCFTSEADGGALFPLFWRNQCVSYSFQAQGSKYISAADAARVAAQAFTAWSSAPCAGGAPTIQADPFPPVECDSANSQGHNNVIIFRDDGWPYDDAANAIGYTTLTVLTGTGEIVGAAIEINSTDYTIVADAAALDAGTSSGPAMTYDLGSILTHEAGHFLGLAHSAESTAVMYARYQPGSTVLTADDIQGICSIYSPDGTRNSASGPIAATQCNPTPPLGFSSACGSLDSGTLVGSGALPEGGDEEDAACPDPAVCSTGRSIGRAASSRARRAPCVLALGCVALALRRRARQASRVARGSAAALGISLALLGATMLGMKDADASISVAVFFEELLQESSAVALVTPVENRSVWEDQRIVTYSHLRVDRLVAGSLPDEVWVRTFGGAVGDLSQVVEGQATFSTGRPTLVFLRPHVGATGTATSSFVVAERAQGQFPIVTDALRPPRLASAASIGALLPPPPAHWTRASRGLPAGTAPRFARDALVDRPVEEAIHEINLAWQRSHSP